MQGLMQDRPLTLDHFFNRAETLFPKKQVVTATAGGIERVTYGEWADRTRRLGGVLDELGISADGRVATFGWNTARHLELYFAAPCSGRVLHTLNIRLFAEQVTYIVNHAEDEVIFVDRSLVGLLWPLLETFKTVRHVVVADDGRGDEPTDAGSAELHRYEDLLAAADAGRVAPPRREPGRVDVLHERHDGQPQGCRVLAPLDLAAHDLRDDRRQHRRLRSRHDPAGRADVPRQRVGPGPRRRGRRRQPRDAGTRPDPAGDRRR